MRARAGAAPGPAGLAGGVHSRAPSLPARRSPAAGPPVSPPASHRPSEQSWHNPPNPYPTPRDASPGTPIKAARSPARPPARLVLALGRGGRGGAGASLHPAGARRSRCFLCCPEVVRLVSAHGYRRPLRQLPEGGRGPRAVRTPLPRKGAGGVCGALRGVQGATTGRTGALATAPGPLQTTVHRHLGAEAGTWRLTGGRGSHANGRAWGRGASGDLLREVPEPVLEERTCHTEAQS